MTEEEAAFSQHLLPWQEQERREEQGLSEQKEESLFPGNGEDAPQKREKGLRWAAKNLKQKRERCWDWEVPRNQD